MNVLLIVPFHADLPLLPSEAESLINTLQPRRVLQGEVTEDRLRSTIQADVDADGDFLGIWLATHSSERAISLSDGPLSRDALCSYVAMAGAEWIVLNGCESEGLAAGISALGVAVVAAAMTDDGSGIGDRDAWRITMPLATALNKFDGDLRAAFDSIPNASRLHRYFAPAPVSRAFTDGDQRLLVLLSDMRADIASVRARVDAVDDKLSVIAADVRDKPSRGPLLAWGVIACGFLLALMLVLLIFHSKGML